MRFFLVLAVMGVVLPLAAPISASAQVPTTDAPMMECPGEQMMAMAGMMADMRHQMMQMSDAMGSQPMDGMMDPMMMDSMMMMMGETMGRMHDEMMAMAAVMECPMIMPGAM